MTKRFILFSMFMFFYAFSFSQKVTNVILVGENGITKNLSEAHSIIVVKELLDKKFQRLDYKKQGPLRKVRTYKDTAMTILDGKYLEYYVSGVLKVSGYYFDNEKNGTWYTYNESNKTISKEKFEKGILLETESPSDRAKSSSEIEGDEKDAVFISKKQNGWQDYIIKSLGKSNAAEKSLKGGEVVIGFVIDTTGHTTNIFVKKSVEYVLDEEAMNVIRKSPKWEPSVKNGKKVPAFRYQPFTFVVY